MASRFAALIYPLFILACVALVPELARGAHISDPIRDFLDHLPSVDQLPRVTYRLLPGSEIREPGAGPQPLTGEFVLQPKTSVCSAFGCGIRPDLFAILEMTLRSPGIELSRTEDLLPIPIPRFENEFFLDRTTDMPQAPDGTVGRDLFLNELMFGFSFEVEEFDRGEGFVRVQVLAVGLDPDVEPNLNRIDLGHTVSGISFPELIALELVLSADLVGIFIDPDLSASFEIEMTETRAKISLIAAPVPEPYSVALLATGVIALLAFRWLKRNEP